MGEQYYVRTQRPQGTRYVIHTVYINGVSVYTFRTDRGLAQCEQRLRDLGYERVPDPWDHK